MAICDEMTENARVSVEQCHGLNQMNRKLKHDLAVAQDTALRSEGFEDEPGPSQRDAARNFIETEFSTCELFLQLADQENNSDTRIRCARNAQAARDRILRFLPTVTYPPDKRIEIHRRLTAIEGELQRLIKTFV